MPAANQPTGHDLEAHASQPAPSALRLGRLHCIIFPTGQRLYSGRDEPTQTIDAESTSTGSLQVRMLDQLGVVLKPIKLSVAGRPEGALEQAVRIIWNRVLLGSYCATGREFSAEASVPKVTVQNFGRWESISALDEPCAALYHVLVRSGDGFWVRDGPVV
ncbi:hypothetical protein DL768_009384 [Monosporascus sp. mg162]|nr:hypothetical protein DL768_009384 [Monosporascus sp. mg162]